MSTLKTIKLQNPSGASSNIDLGVGGEVLIGSASTTGTASQTLQVTGGAYVSGSVGIGYTNPGAKLTVAGELTLGRTDSVNEGGQINFNRSVDDASAYAIDVYGNTAANSRLRFIDAAAGAERVTLDRAGNFIVGTSSSTGTASQRLQVTGSAYVSGNLGIGTTRPTTKLDVSGIGQFLSNGATLNLVGTDHSYIQWYPDGIAAGRKAYTGYPGSSNNYFTITNEISDGTGHINLDPGTNAAVLIKTTSATGTASQNLQVTGGAYVSGSVGIGTTNPQQTLHVVGIITATSYRGDGSQLTGVSVGTDITSSLFS